MHSCKLTPCSACLSGLLIFTALAAPADERPSILRPGEQAGTATIIHRADVVPARATNAPPRGGLWPLYASAEARLNYFEVVSRTGMHFHPDADHRLYVLEGKVIVTAGTNTTVAGVGDFIVIPKGVRHCYDVQAKGDRALLLTFDAPPFDPQKTVNVEAAVPGK